MTSPLNGNALIEAWRAMDDTVVAYQPAFPLPPADLDTRDTAPWLEPVRFFGEPVRFSADHQLPSNCQHSLASALEDVTKDVRAAAPSAQLRDTQAVAARLAPGGVEATGSDGRAPIERMP